MQRRALLIGSQILGLRGTYHDVEAMHVLLSRHDFAIATCTEAAATRKGILAAYRTLIEQAEKDDPVIVYYSGHGAHAEDASGHRVQYILPTDWVEDDNIFNGIVDTELSDLLQKLTTKTTNVTVILDCCHSSMMARGGLFSRAVVGKWTKALEKHVEQSPSRFYITENPHAVRLVATEADRSAFEADQEVDGKLVPRGFFTRALQRVLEEPESAALSWRAVSNRVREMVLERVAIQQPSVEGPADRTIFTILEQSRPDAVVYFEHHGKPALRASRLLGAGIGVEYDIVRRGEVAVTDSSRVATATITAFDGSAALVALTHRTEKLLPGALAFPKRSLFPKVRAAVTGRDELDLREKLSSSSFVELVDHERARFVVDVHEQKLVLTDQLNGPVYSFELPNDLHGRELDVPKRRALAVQWVERWAKAEALRAMPSSVGGKVVELTWGCVVNGTLIPRGVGDSFRVGEKLCLYAKNTSQRDLYMWAIDIGVSGKVTILSVADQGQRVEPGARLAIGADKGNPEGLELEWPDELPVEVGPRRESLVVIAANYSTDVSVFETADLIPRDPGQPSSVLEDMLRAFGAGTPRDIGAPRLDQMHWVARVDFELDPRPCRP